MTPPSGALLDARRPLLSSSLWVPLSLVLAACAVIAYFGHQVAVTQEQSVAATARAGGQAMAREITGFIDREHERLRAFVEEKDEAIRSILAAPDDWRNIEALEASVKRAFPGVIAFTVTGADGMPLFENFDGLVGPTCQATMRTFAQTMDFGRDAYEVPPIHPVPGAYHFDLISPWRLDSGQFGVFFVSMSPQRMAELLATAEKASGMRYLLVNRTNPDLIEVASAGARDRLDDNFRVDEASYSPWQFVEDLPGTHWQLLVLPDADAVRADVARVYRNVTLLVTALLLISASLLYLIRRAEQRNSTLFMRSLQSSVSRQRAILQSMVDGMVTIDATGRILHVNNAVSRMFGFDARELIGANVRVLMPEPDRSAHDGYLQHYMATGESRILGRGREVMARRRDGSVFPVLLTLGESIEGDQRIFVGIIHDMSAYRDAQRQIVAQAMAIERSRAEMEEISQMASRELQLPLQRIASLGERLGAERLDSLTGNEKAELKSLTDEARGMSELVQGLADYAHEEHRRVADEAVSLDAVLRDVQGDLAALIASTGATVTVGALVDVKGDHRQLRQVFWNLIENALKFRDPERPPRIQVSLADQEQAAGTGTADDLVTVLVSDNGIGIPDDQLEPVFDAFRRLHPREDFPGMGLGLSFCRKIVTACGGRISATSRVGEGSVFHVTLPRAR